MSVETDQGANIRPPIDQSPGDPETEVTGRARECDHRVGHVHCPWPAKSYADMRVSSGLLSILQALDLWRVVGNRTDCSLSFRAEMKPQRTLLRPAA